MTQKSQKQKKSSAKPAQPKGLRARLWAARALNDVLKQGAFIDAALTVHRPETATQQDSSLAHYLTSFAVRHKGQLDEVLKVLMQKGMPKRSGLLEAALRIGLLELIYLNRPAHSAVHLAVQICKKDRRAGSFAKLANGVLRNGERQREDFLRLPNQLNIPHWLQKRWRHAYGADTLVHMAALVTQRPPLDIYWKKDATGFDGLTLTKLDDRVVRFDKLEGSVSELPHYQTGDWWVQDLAATFAARLFDLPEGSEVADLCAAPGGKTMQLAELGFQTFAYDISAHRLEQLAQNLIRTKLEAHSEALDIANHDFQRQFEGVLLDAPCTATGTFRRHPELLWQREKSDIKDRAQLQRDMLQNAATLIKPSGQLIYCTCSLEPEEGEHQVDWFLNAHPQFQPDEIKSGELGAAADFLTEAGTIRTVPGKAVEAAHKGQLDGFFVARFTRAH